MFFMFLLSQENNTKQTNKQKTRKQTPEFVSPESERNKCKIFLRALPSPGLLDIFVAMSPYTFPSTFMLSRQGMPRQRHLATIQSYFQPAPPLFSLPGCILAVGLICACRRGRPQPGTFFTSPSGRAGFGALALEMPCLLSLQHLREI